MKSKIVSSVFLAAAVLAAGSSYAEGRDIYSGEQTTFISTKTREAVQAELAQAQREGFSSSLPHNWTGEKSVSTSKKTREQVQSENSGGPISTSALEHDYPFTH